jgi:RNA polymerase sigma factor (sigma-70 family)
MADQDFLAERFEADRTRLTGVAYRMLGSASEADDAVQEAWLRLSRSDTHEIDNLTAWLTTVVGRVCLDMLRSRRTRAETPLEATGPIEADDDPEREAMLADSVGKALLVVLDTLNPAERLSFVLHDMFAVPFEDIAPVVGRTPEAARQLASRARRRVQGEKMPEADVSRQKEVVDAFLAASRAGEFDRLLALLDPDVVMRGDPAAVSLGNAPEMRGASTIATFFKGRAQAARPVLVDGTPGLGVWFGEKLKIVLVFTVDDGRVSDIEAIADLATIAELDVLPRSPRS